MTIDDYYYHVNNRCSKCGKPKIYVGDVPERMLPGTEPYCTCDQIFGRVQSGGVGWVCPNVVVQTHPGWQRVDVVQT